ncbi:unnamed protein product [Sphagnum troendelagicum]|uniref:Uncharacterized protein n=1 Tax=Sphagnum troendelagicum TaxID=128251 RepID=A0ABP0TEJ9_9BRYO
MVKHPALALRLQRVHEDLELFNFRSSTPRVHEDSLIQYSWHLRLIHSLYNRQRLRTGQTAADPRLITPVNLILYTNP